MLRIRIRVKVLIFAKFHDVWILDPLLPKRILNRKRHINATQIRNTDSHRNLSQFFDKLGKITASVHFMVPKCVHDTGTGTGTYSWMWDSHPNISVDTGQGRYVRIQLPVH
jgi:hypothetical protein